MFDFTQTAISGPLEAVTEPTEPLQKHIYDLVRNLDFPVIAISGAEILRLAVSDDSDSQGENEHQASPVISPARSSHTDNAMSSGTNID